MQLNLSRKMRDTITAYLFLSSFLMNFIVFLGYPILYSLFLSFRIVTPTTDLFRVSDMKFVGFDNYIRLMMDYNFWVSLLVTFYYAILYIPLLIGALPFTCYSVEQSIKGSFIF